MGTSVGVDSERDFLSLEYRNAQMVSPSVVATVPWNGFGTPWATGDRSVDEPDRLLDGGWRVVLEAESEGEKEQHLGVGLAPDLWI